MDLSTKLSVHLYGIATQNIQYGAKVIWYCSQLNVDYDFLTIVKS